MKEENSLNPLFPDISIRPVVRENDPFVRDFRILSARIISTLLPVDVANRTHGIVGLVALVIAGVTLLAWTVYDANQAIMRPYSRKSLGDQVSSTKARF